MKWAVAALVVIGVVAALAAAVLTAAVRAREGKDEAESGPTEMDILVATRDLSAMAVIDASAMAFQTVWSNEAPRDALTDPVQVIGRVLVVPILANEAFVVGKLAKEGDRVHLAAALPEGGRAMSVTVATDTGVEELLYPGSLIDVIASFRLPPAEGTASGEIVSATLLQAVQVLAVGRESVVSGNEETETESSSSKAGPTRRSVVTLMVDAKQAEALQLAMMHGSIALALRNPLDTRRESIDGLLLSDLSGEIAQQLGVLARSGISSEPLGVPMIFDDASEEPAEGPSAGEPSPESPQWEVVVLRGRVMETQTFSVQGIVTTEVEVVESVESRAENGESRE